MQNTDKNPQKKLNAIITFHEDRPLIHYGLIRFSEAVIQLYTQKTNDKKLLVTCIIKDCLTNQKTYTKQSIPLKKGYWLNIERMFISLKFLSKNIYQEKPEVLEKDFRMSTWDDILDFFQSSDEFNTWVEKE